MNQVSIVALGYSIRYNDPDAGDCNAGDRPTGTELADVAKELASQGTVYAVFLADAPSQCYCPALPAQVAIQRWEEEAFTVPVNVKP